MLQVVTLFLIIGVLGGPVNSASLFEDIEDHNELNLEWFCNEICKNSNGKPDFNSTTTICHCLVEDLENSDINWNHLKRKANLIGLNLETIDLKPKNQRKRAISKDTKKLDLFKRANLITEQNTTETVIEQSDQTKNETVDTSKTLKKHTRKICRRQKPSLLSLAKQKQEQQNEIQKDKELLNKLEELRKKFRERMTELRKQREARLQKNTT